MESGIQTYCWFRQVVLNIVLTISIFVFSLAFAESLLASGTIIQPVSVTSSKGHFDSRAIPENLINQTGLLDLNLPTCSNQSRPCNDSGCFASYTSGVTNFNTFIANTVAQNCSGTSTWLSNDNTHPPANLDFNLGRELTINKMVIWGNNGLAMIKSISLIGSLMSDFSSPIVLGDFTVNNPTSAIAPPEVFSFPSTSVQYIRVTINSVHGSQNFAGASNEIAFGEDDPSDFGIIGEESVFISAHGKVIGSGRVASNGTLTTLGYAAIEGFTQSIGPVEIGSNAQNFNRLITNSTLNTGQRCRLENDVDAGGPVKLGANTKVTGNVTSADEVTLGTNASVGGTITDFGSPVSIAATVLLPTCTVLPPGSDDLATPKNSGPHIVLPGYHKDYTYRSSNTVVFEGGEYSFETLFFGAKTNIEFQGPTTIYISKELAFSNNVKQTLTNVNPEDVVYVLAPDIFTTIGARSTIFGTFCATGSEVIILNNASLTGAAYAKTVKIGKYSTFITAPADLP